MTRKPVLTIMFLTASLALAACGSKKTANSGYNDLSSREIPGRSGSGSNSNGSGGLLAECNRFGFNMSGSTYSVSLSTFYTGNTFREDLIHMMFNSAPEGIHKDSTQYIQIYRWEESTVGDRNTNTTPVSMYFMEKSSGEILNENSPVRSISRNTILSAIQGHSNLRAASFFDDVSIILDGMEIQWDAIMIVVYDSANNAVISSVDALLPAFSADPNVYAARHASTSLQILHPNYSRRASGESENEYFKYTEEFCQDFL